MSDKPFLDKIWDLLQSLRGGAESIQSLADNQAAMLDLAESAQSASTVMDGTEQILYEETDPSPFEFRGGWIDFTGLHAGAGEDTTIKLYVKIKTGGTYRVAWQGVYLAAAVPARNPVQIPNILDDAANSQIQAPFDNMFGVKITAQQAAVGGGWNTLDHSWYDAKRGG